MRRSTVFSRAISRSTSAGSNAEPAYSRSSAIASASLRAGRYGRSACSVLKQSAMASTRAPTGMSLPRSPAGIAETVPSLVMAQHEIADRRAERHVLQNLGADARVNLDAIELLGRQRVRLRQDVFGHRHVADVVQQRGRADRLDVGVRQSGGFREHARRTAESIECAREYNRLVLRSRAPALQSSPAARPSRAASRPAPRAAATPRCGSCGTRGRAARRAAPAIRTSRATAPRSPARRAPHRRDSSARSRRSSDARRARPADVSTARSPRRPATVLVKK